MSILILNSIPHYRNPYEKHLKELGEELIVLTAEKHKEGFEVGDFAYVESFENYDHSGSIEKRALELYDQYQYHTILADYEFDIYRAAELRELLNLKGGQTVSSSQVYRNKVLMKERVQRHGIKVPTFQEIKSPLDLILFVKEHGYPIVIKPIDGAGSMETLVIHNETELNSFLSDGIPHHIMAESFIKGDLYHVDGFVYNGEIIFLCASKYLQFPIEYSNTSYTGGYVLPPNQTLAKRLTEETRKVVEALETPLHTSIHAEWFHTEDDQIIFCEIASRAGGGRIKETVEYTFGFNVYEAANRAKCNLPIQLPPEKEIDTIYGRILMMSKEGTFLSPPDSPSPVPVVLEEIIGKKGKHYDGPYNCTDAIAAFVVDGKTENEVVDKLMAISKWFENGARWE
ncbi:Biotin carboxylase [Seinonella peptonophila]|uniref:Biotin carboxylase n=1 Tax=Seinonella peptonophila TaxID=112248 RepID=A0A1M4V906_9BACL|nr:ATP-grasp domain-containing protein [Seinonella peptonophila]SHE65449.1 Biotin carboxylase [Seinonella peptonophila]